MCQESPGNVAMIEKRDKAILNGPADFSNESGFDRRLRRDYNGRGLQSVVTTRSVRNVSL